MNHADTPYFLLTSPNRLETVYEKTDLEKPLIDRPNVNGDMLDASSTKGACLGFAILKTKMTGVPHKI